jgi:hypothetical protein
MNFVPSIAAARKVITCRVPSAVLLADLMSPGGFPRCRVDSSSQQGAAEGQKNQQQQEQGQELPSAVTPWQKGGEASGAVLLCPGSAGLPDDGFVLHTSQSYSRVSQPAISPNVAAGLAAPADDEEEPAEEQFTTPSQDSKVCQEPGLDGQECCTATTAGAVAKQCWWQHLPPALFCSLYYCTSF